jgi:CDGSH-type Zn-finger protein
MILYRLKKEENKMEKPVVAAKQPIAVDLVEGRERWWCACGRSSDQPFCDGSHQGTGIEPLGFKAQNSGEAWLCRCKQTKTPPYCDGSHKTVED